MKRKIKFTYIAFILVFCFSLCTIKAFAVLDNNEPSGNSDVTTPITQPIVTNPPTNPPQPQTEKPTKPKKPAKPKETTNNYVQRPATNPATNYVPPAQRTTYAQNNTEAPAVQSTTSNSALYNVDGEEVDEDTLKDSDWEDIEAQLQNAGNADDDSDSFNFIKKNNSKLDDGFWILAVGIILDAAAAGIIITLIVLAVRRKKKIYDSPISNPPRYGPPSGPKGSSQRPMSKSQQRQVKKRSKYDTDEVYIPKNAVRNSSGGRHYKPRH